MARRFRESTELATAGKDLRLLLAIVQSSHDAILSTDANGIITYFNPAAERMSGYTREEAIGQHFGFLVPPQRREEVRELDARLRDSENVVGYETQRRTRTGGWSTSA